MVTTPTGPRRGRGQGRYHNRGNHSYSFSSASDNSSRAGNFEDAFAENNSPNQADPMTNAFEKLKIEGQTSRFFRGGRARRNTQTAATCGQNTNEGRDFDEIENTNREVVIAPYRRGRGHANRWVTSYPGGHRGRGGGTTNFRGSTTWVSSDTQQMNEFMVIRNSMRRLFKNSPLAKWKFNDYIAHCEAMVASRARILAEKVKMKEEGSEYAPVVEHNSIRETLERVLPGNFSMEGNMGRVLGEKTIWCKDWKNGKDEIAPWPTESEMRWEGDDRAKTGVGRYLPLPREPSPPGIMWNQLQVVDQYPMDQVQLIPTMEDVYLPVDEIDDDVKYQLLHRDLEEAMDAFLEI